MEIVSYRLDFALPSAKINLEIDGYWHNHRKKQDKKRDLVLASMGWKVIRISTDFLTRRPEQAQTWIQEQILTRMEV
jgi:very-short-patch-repair endonuclease